MHITNIVVKLDLTDFLFFLNAVLDILNLKYS